jgi:hypothetical protein
MTFRRGRFATGWAGVIGAILLFSVASLWAQNTQPAKGRKDTKPAPMPQLTKLAWLAGSWRTEMAGRVTEEQWMAPSGGTMLGMSRTVVKGRVVEYEFMQIREGPGGTLFFIAQPSGQKEAAFQLLSLADNGVIFENPAHDFPQRILYTREADDSVLAAIEGPLMADDSRKRIEFPYKRAKP